MGGKGCVTQRGSKGKRKRRFLGFRSREVGVELASSKAVKRPCDVWGQAKSLGPHPVLRVADGGVSARRGASNPGAG